MNTNSSAQGILSVYFIFIQKLIAEISFDKYLEYFSVFWIHFYNLFSFFKIMKNLNGVDLADLFIGPGSKQNNLKRERQRVYHLENPSRDIQDGLNAGDSRSGNT